MLKRLALPALLALSLTAVLIAQDTGAISRLLGATDTNSNLKVRMTAGSGVVQSRQAIGSLFGKVDSAGNLYVTQDSTVPATMGNPALFGDGTTAAPSIAFTSQTGTGFYFVSTNNIGVTNSGVSSVLLGQNLIRMGSTGTYAWGSGGAIATAADTQFSRVGAGQIGAGSTTVQPVINGTLTTSSASVCTPGNVTETDLWTYTLPAGALNVDGRGVRITVFATTAANANNKQLRVYFGATMLHNHVGTDNGFNFEFQSTVLRTGAASQTTFGKESNPNGTNITKVAAAETMANAIIIRMTGQQIAAAGGDICVSGAVVETIK